MHLEIKCAQRVSIPVARLDLCFEAGETIHTDNSYKFTHRAVRTLLKEAGFAIEQCWTDHSDWYAVTLARLP